MNRIHPSVFNLYTMPESEQDHVSIDYLRTVVESVPADERDWERSNADDFDALWEGR